MTDLSEYLNQKDEVNRLNNQINLMADFYHDVYINEIELLKAKLKNALRSKSDYKRKSELVKPITRKESVFAKLKSGVTNYNLIAKECFTTYGVVKNYANLLKKES